MAHTELRKQLRDFQDKGFILPSISPWGLQCLLLERSMCLIECALINTNGKNRK